MPANQAKVDLLPSKILLMSPAYNSGPLQVMAEAFSAFTFLQSLLDTEPAPIDVIKARLSIVIY